MSDPTVFIVDDEQTMRMSMRRLLQSVGLAAETYRSAQEFLDKFDPSRPGCLVLDVRMPGMSGIELQERLRREGFEIPIILISGYGDIAMAVRAIKAGAMDFIEKPFRPQDLLDLIWQAIEHDRELRTEQSEREELDRRIAGLTHREREVLDLVVKGLSVNQIARQLGLSPKTVHAHRAEGMAKMRVGSIAELARYAVTGRVTNDAATSNGRFCVGK